MADDAMVSDTPALQPIIEAPAAKWFGFRPMYSAMGPG